MSGHVVLDFNFKGKVDVFSRRKDGWGVSVYFL